MTTAKEQGTQPRKNVAGRLHQVWTECGWLSLGCLFVLIAVQAEADKSETDVMTANRQRIADMTRIERDRLEHNQKQFQELTAEEKDHIRDLHKEVSSNANLSATLSAYHRWLETLPPEQRDRVLTAKPDDRIALIESLTADAWPVHPNADAYPPGDGNGPGRFQLPFWMRPTRGGIVFSEAEFESLIASIAEWLKSDLRLEDKSPVAVLRYRVKVVDAMVERVMDSNIGRNEQDRPNPLIIPEQLMQKMISSLPNRGSKVVPQLRGQPSLFMQTIIRTLGLEMSKLLEFEGAKSAKLEQFAAQMPPFKRAEIEQLDETARESMLTRMWYEREIPDVMATMKKLAGTMNRDSGIRDNGQRPPVPRRFSPQN